MRNVPNEANFFLFFFFTQLTVRQVGEIRKLKMSFRFLQEGFGFSRRTMEERTELSARPSQGSTRSSSTSKISTEFGGILCFS